MPSSFPPSITRDEQSKPPFTLHPRFLSDIAAVKGGHKSQDILGAEALRSP